MPGTIQRSTVSSLPAVWRLDPAHTQVEFAVRHLMITTTRGRFTDVNGTVTVPDGDFSRAHVEATIGVASVDTHEPQRDAHLRSPDFFDVERFPAILFVSRRVEPDRRAENRFVLVGDLTIRDITREVRLDVTLEGQSRDPWGNEHLGFSLDGTVNRKDFGLTWNLLLETGGVAVGDEVKISIQVELLPKPEQVAA